jgi:hypothetical protein
VFVVQITVFVQFGIISALAPHPLTRTDGSGVFGNGSLNLGNRVHRRVGRVDLAKNDALRPGQWVGVDVDQTGQHGTSLQIDSAAVPV